MSNKVKKVLLVGPILSNSGYGEHARCVLRSLIRNIEKFDIYIAPTSWGATSTDTRDTPENKFIINCIKRTQQYKEGKYDISLQVALPNEWKKIAPINIGITAAVETDRCNPEWIRNCNEMDKVITISEHASTSLTKHAYPLQDKQGNHVGTLSCENNPKVIGYPVKEYIPDDFSKNLNISEKCFLSVAQFAPRKNVEALIRSFVEEFKEEEVGLVLKANMVTDSIIDRRNTSQLIGQMLKAIDPKDKRKCKIHLLHGRLTEDELHSLYSDPRIFGYVTTTHGEGFGLPVFEAVYSGLPVIAPTWSGYLDFLKAPVVNETSGKVRSKNLFLKTRFELKPVDPRAIMQGIIIEGSQWAYIDEKHFKKNMRSLLESPTSYRNDAKILQEHIRNKFSEEKIYSKFLNEILDSLGSHPDLAPKPGLDEDDFALFKTQNL